VPTDCGTRAEGGGRFEEVVLRPVVTVASEDVVERAHELHDQASELCFIASSVNFPVHHEPEIVVEASEPTVASSPGT
jgi:organic hydroperoxide reductase OsmC/OhrA